MGLMATTKRPRAGKEPLERKGDPVGGPAGPPDDPDTDKSGNAWDWSSGPPVPAAPAGETMPRRASGLASQNGPAMRSVFAYLLDEETAPTPEPAKPKKR